MAVHGAAQAEALVPLLEDIQAQGGTQNIPDDSISSRVWRLWETARNLLDKARDLLQSLNCLSCRSLARDRSGEKHLEQECIFVEIASSSKDELSLLNGDLKSTNSENIYICDAYISERQLKVEQVAGTDYPTIHKVAQEWVKIAQEKAAKAGEIPIENEGSFLDCHSMIGGIAKTLQNGPPKNDYFFRVITPSPEELALNLVESYQTRIFICKDKDDRIQGMMKLCVENAQVYVSQIATNPKNIRSWVNKDESEKVKGAGSALMRMAEKVTLDLKRDELYLFSLRNSKPFYRKLNFIENNPSSPHMSRMYKLATQIESIPKKAEEWVA